MSPVLALKQAAAREGSSQQQPKKGPEKEIN